MGTAQFGEDPKTMISVATLPDEERSEARRRLHLRDITSEIQGTADTVGADFRMAREHRGEDLRHVVQALRIRREQLEALEESRYADLPGRTYAVGFVRAYAEYLGLDTERLVERYKAEIDREGPREAELGFPELATETRLPRGTFLIIALIVAAGIYGGYLLTHSADRMMADRVPPVPERMEARMATSGDITDERPASLSGDPASAATRPYGNATAAQILGAGAPNALVPESVYAVAPSAPAPAGGSQAPMSVVAAQAPSAGVGANQPADLAPAATPVAASGLPPIAAGQALGGENIDGRVVIRSRKNNAWIRVESADGHVLIERTLAAGDSYRVPGKPGNILVARDASAFEILVDGASLGLAGPPTLVLTGKSLDPDALIAAMPRLDPTPVGTAASAAAPAPGAPAVVR